MYKTIFSKNNFSDRKSIIDRGNSIIWEGADIERANHKIKEQE